MTRSNLFLLAIALAIFGTAVIAGHPHWGTFTGLVILLLAGATAAGSLPLGSEPYFVVQSVPHQKISNSLVTLSSAAVLAVYIAGYHRTGSAADGFAAQAARRKTAAPLVASAVAPKTATPRVDATPAVRAPFGSALQKGLSTSFVGPGSRRGAYASGQRGFACDALRTAGGLDI